MHRVVLAYSGGRLTSAMIPWLVEEHAVEVVTVTVDLGQGQDLAVIRERALSLGAVRAHVLDAREQLVQQCVLGALQAGATDTAGAPLATALAWPLLAARLLEVARMESASAVAHGGHAAALRAIALATAIESLDRSIPVIAAPTFEMMAMLESPAAHTRSIGSETTVWGREVWLQEGDAAEAAFLLTRSLDAAPGVPAFLDIAFVEGVPVKTNGVDMPLLELIESLDTIAGAHAVGRWHVAGQDRVIEAPAATVLHGAYEALEAHVLDASVRDTRRLLGKRYADAVIRGIWFSDIRRSIAAFNDALTNRMTGTVRLRLFKGQCTVMDVDPQRAVAAGTAAGPKAVA